MTLPYEVLKAFADENRELKFKQSAEAQSAVERAEAVRTLKRSEMTPKAKSDFITKHGKEAYFAIPW